MLTLRQGAESITVASPPRLAGHFRGPSGEALTDVRGAVMAALAEPTDAPAYKAALVPGDNVVIAADAETPELAAILDAVVSTLGEAEVEPETVTVVLGPTLAGRAPATESLRDSLSDRCRDVTLAVHDPDNEKEHAYLASSTEGRRLYLDRRVVDADSVLAIGRVGFDPVLGMAGTAGDLFPILSNAETRAQARRLAIDARTATDTLRSRQICDEVGWLVGLFYGIGVAVDRDQAIEQVWAGRFQAVQERGEAHARKQWTVERPANGVDLVVATLGRTNQPATWSMLADACESAIRLVKPDGRIVVIADLAEPLGEAGNQMVDLDNPWPVLANLRTSDAPDALSTVQLLEAIATSRVHLLSRLPADLVESLAMVPVDSARDVEHLMSRSESCFILEDADRAYVPMPAKGHAPIYTRPKKRKRTS